MNPQDDVNPLHFQSLKIIKKKKRPMEQPEITHDHLHHHNGGDNDSAAAKRLRSGRPLSQSTHIPTVPTAIFEQLSIKTAGSNTNHFSSKKKRNMAVDDDDDDGESPPWKAMKRLRMSSSDSISSNPQAASSTMPPKLLPYLTQQQQPEPTKEELKTPPTGSSTLNQYFQVNHILGALHVERQRRLHPNNKDDNDDDHVETPRAATVVTGLASRNPPSTMTPCPKTSHKKMVQLRTSSKLG